MAPQHKVWKQKPTKDGRNAKQRRADKKRAARLTSEAHLTQVANGLKNKIHRQSNRWLDYNLRADDVRGCQNECRWGFKWDTQLCERLDRERADARRAAGVGPEDWVDDWWGPIVRGGNVDEGNSTGARVGTGAGAGVEEKGEELLERDLENEEGKKAEGKDEEEGENPDRMSGIERGVSRLGL